jgi:uncharacterized membrane protein
MSKAVPRLLPALAALALALALAFPLTPANTAEELPLLSVIGVAPNDMLNLREQPDARAPIVGRLPPNTRNVVIIGQPVSNLDWIMVQSGNLRGWANARFLAYGDPQQQGRLPARLHCAGTEPFWGIEVGYGRAQVNFAAEQRLEELRLASPVPAAARPSIWLTPSGDPADPASFLLIEARTCSDGMSDRAHPFTLVARTKGPVLSGCCW